MSGFSLKKGAETFDFDISGTVSKGGHHVGIWSTDRNNKVVLKKDVGGQDLYDVVWQFNQDNQLTISSEDKQVFNFNNIPGVRPIYSTQNAVLKIKPDQNNIFDFELRGEWGIDNNHDLVITISGKKSVIDGFIQDPRSRFMYHFFNKQNLMQESILGFVGEWEFTNDNGVPKLHFKYKREDGTTNIFLLPQGIVVNRSINQFMYQYNKQENTYAIQFVGLLQVSRDLRFTYSIDRQVSRTGQVQVGATTFAFGAVLNKKNFSGDIEFFIKKTDGTMGSTTIGLRGNWTAKLGETDLQVGFAFSQTRGPNTVTTTFTLSGSIMLKSGGQVVFAISRDSTSTTIGIALSDIKLGPASLDTRVNIKNEKGQVFGVQILFGVRF